ncbi:isocitrate lyase/phosphoenolpyruvate mutase family protein [Nonomuraea sp. NPDC050783]|uniref:isocitrate lyase/PEP mutase family protein n=1 Tax=Nonomuraea sp. NPDC050783 TaxID=3154634 RepID=UPI00346725F6
MSGSSLEDKNAVIPGAGHAAPPPVEAATTHRADRSGLRDKAELLRALHVPGAPLVLPNAWDVGSARAVVEAGFPVVATASNAIAAALGHDDGEGAPIGDMMFVARRIAASVAVPVTVDAEAGYGMAPEELVQLLVGIGAAGCNIEDSDHVNGGLVDVDVRAAYLARMREAAGRIGVPLVVNARIDSFFPTSPLPGDRRRADAIRRAGAYLAAGADCVFPAGAGPEDLRAIVAEAGGPVNAGLALGRGSLDELRAIGVARVSVGPQLYRGALDHLRTALRPLLQEVSEP